MATRREAREHALALCYEIETRGVSAAQVLDGLPAPPDAYTQTLVRGVDEHRRELDALLSQFSQRWAVERMPAIDRALLRMGAYELGHRREIPVAVVIDEAVELAGEYSTEDSPRFVNALLARIAEELRA